MERRAKNSHRRAILGVALLACATRGFANDEPRKVAVVRIGGCSGVCIDPSGIVLTAKHCSLGEREVISFVDREPVVAERIVVGPDAEDAVAYLLPPGEWPSLRIAESVPTAGVDVWSGGYPERNGRRFRAARGTLVGGGEHQLLRNGVPVGKFLANETDIVTGPGWYGGPLVSEEGRVIGLLSAGNDDGSTFVSWAATKRAHRAARLVLQARDRPHLLVFGFPGCQHCETFLADHPQGRFDRFEVEYVDVMTPAGRERYESLRSALERATGTRPPSGFPAFHVAGRAAMTVGYATGDGWRRLLDWLRETLRLPVTGFEAIVGNRDTGVSPDPGAPTPRGDAQTPPPPTTNEPSIGPTSPFPDDVPGFPAEDEPLPWWAMVAGSVLRLLEERLMRANGAGTGEEVAA